MLCNFAPLNNSVLCKDAQIFYMFIQTKCTSASLPAVACYVCLPFILWANSKYLHNGTHNYLQKPVTFR